MNDCPAVLPYKEVPAACGEDTERYGDVVIATLFSCVMELSLWRKICAKFRNITRVFIAHKD